MLNIYYQNNNHANESYTEQEAIHETCIALLACYH